MAKLTTDGELADMMTAAIQSEEKVLRVLEGKSEIVLLIDSPNAVVETQL